MRILEPPEEVLLAEERQEVLRAWIDGGMLSVSVASVFPENYRDERSEIWGMLISDIFHHVVDAVVAETGRDRNDVQDSLRRSLHDVAQSQRGSRFGKLKIFDRRWAELPDPDVSGDDNSVEIVRIALLRDSIRVMVFVGMWLPDNEESVWGNLIYDMSSMLASSMKPEGNADELKDELIRDVINYIDHPSTKYSGEYYDTEQTHPPNPDSADAPSE
jgi:hypothetical protein